MEDERQHGANRRSHGSRPPQPTTVTLVDKPGAAQSVISVCLVGTERKTPDYFPLLVMNSIFGGQFSSRLNMNLREEKGYTYGAGRRSTGGSTSPGRSRRGRPCRPP